jgi:hypothetical protein
MYPSEVGPIEVTIMNSKAIIIALTTTLLLSGCNKRPVNANPNSSATPPTPDTASQTSDESATARKRAAAVGAPPEPAAYRGFDIHGFRLGMTRREVEANAKKTLSSFAVSHEEATMAASQSYADDPIHPYLSQLEFRNGDLRLYFSPPPRGGRVVGIVLVEQGLDAEPLASIGAYKAAHEEIR